MPKTTEGILLFLHEYCEILSLLEIVVEFVQDRYTIIEEAPEEAVTRR